MDEISLVGENETVIKTSLLKIIILIWVCHFKSKILLRILDISFIIFGDKVNYTMKNMDV